MFVIAISSKLLNQIIMNFKKIADASFKELKFLAIIKYSKGGDC